MEKQSIGAEKFRWDLSFLYSDINDPQIDADINAFKEKAQKFHITYKGNLSQALGGAIVDYSELMMLEYKISAYFFLRQSINVADNEVKTKKAEVNIILSQIEGEYLTFFEIEIVALEDNLLKNLYNDSVVKKHQPWIEYTRIFKPHLLSESVESALTKRSPFGSYAWSEFFNELESDIEIEFYGEKKTLVEMHNIILESKNSQERFEAMTAINDSLKGFFAKYSAQNLYMVVGSGAIEDRERFFQNPMERRNKGNRVSGETVDALHEAVYKVAGPIAQKYYRLKAKLLGLKILQWSDRNAPLPFSDTAIIPFEEALKIVLAAYESFSPTLANLIRELAEAKRIDAPAIKGKRSGAFNSSFVLPGNTPASFTFLNYLGSNNDVMTLAHELGHGVHGLLAGKKQGVLMYRAPIAYCETASIFGEMATFDFLKKKLLEKGNKELLLALLMRKIDDILNTTVRQIGFSNFERRIHGMDNVYKNWQKPKKLSVEELNAIWLETLKLFYGEEGNIFSYKNTEYLWSYINHFHRPFYVYGYAFGEFLTQNIYAQQKKLGTEFEPLYLELLKSGMTKDVVELLEPFGLDPRDDKFWTDGINNGLGNMVEEVENLTNF